MNYSNLVKGFFLFPFLLFAYNLNSQVPCECTNCPVAIEDNGTFEAYLDVIINDPSYGWDGTFDGQLVTSGTYVYSIEVAFVDGHVIQLAGDITVTK